MPCFLARHAGHCSYTQFGQITYRDERCHVFPFKLFLSFEKLAHLRLSAGSSSRVFLLVCFDDDDVGWGVEGSTETTLISAST